MTFGPAFLFGALMACSSDPELERTRDALDAWERGVALLEEGDPASAQVAFSEAKSHRPEDALLLAWEGKAAADGGHLEVAVQLLDEALRMHPGLVEARYNRAAYLARLGKPVDSARELKRALSDGARPARDVLQDPDFKPFLEHAAFDFLPVDALSVAVEYPTETVFWGSECEILFRVGGADEVEPIGVTAEVGSGPIALRYVVEDTVLSTDGPIRDLRWTYKVVGAGTVNLGPFHVWVGNRKTMVKAIQFETLAPPDKVAPTPEVHVLSTPRELLARMEPPSVRLSPTGLLVVTEPGDHVQVENNPPYVRYEIREKSQVKWILYQYPQAIHATVKRRGKVVYEGP